jgi:hypothetical protein
MTLKRTTAVIAALWLLILGTWGWERHRLAGLQVALGRERAQRLEIQAKVAAAAARARAAQRESARLSSAIDSLHKAAPSPRLATLKVPGEADFRAALAQNPELRAAYLKGIVADLNTKWGLFFRELGLSPEQAADFIAIQLRLEQTRLDQAALGAGADPGPLQAAEREAAQEIRDLIGDDNLPLYKAYNHETGALTLVSDLPHFSAGDMEPLTPDQALGLAQILADASNHRPGGQVIYGTVSWEAAMPAAQALLTPNQFVALQLMASEKIVQWEREETGQAR